MGPRLRFLVLFTLLIPLLLAARPAAAAQIEVTRNEGSAEFPTSLRFELEARSAATITDVTLLWGGAVDEVLTEVRPEFEPGREVEVSYERDTQLYFLPAGVKLRYKWELRDESGATYVTPFQELFYDDDRFDWRERSERNITVRWYDGDDDWGAELLDASLRTLDRFERELGGTLTDPVRITIYGNNEDMRGALPPNSNEWIGGQARPNLGLVIGSIEEGNSDEVRRLIPHELSHVVLYQMTKDSPYGGPPPWFDEGLAVVNEEVGIAGFEEQVPEAAREGRLIPLRALSSNFPPDPNEAYLSYAQSASVVRFIQETYGDEKFKVMVERFAEGDSPDEAAEAALGLSVDELDAAWRKTMPEAEADEVVPTPTPALHAPPERFKIKTRPASELGAGGDEEDEEDEAQAPGEGGSSGGLLAGVPGWLITLGVVAIGLLLIGGFLIVVGLRR